MVNVSDWLDPRPELPYVWHDDGRYSLNLGWCLKYNVGDQSNPCDVHDEPLQAADVDAPEEAVAEAQRFLDDLARRG